MLKNKFQPIFLAILLTGCSQENTNSSDDNASLLSPLINLVESTHIIRALISQNEIGHLLEEHDPELLTLLLDNKSPAQMAFEAEVLSSIIPLVVVYYFQNDKEQNMFIDELKALAFKYKNEAKFVIADAEKLFSLVEDAQLETFPAILFVKEREILDSFEGTLNIEKIEDKLASYM